jgi:hypothetical protein
MRTVCLSASVPALGRARHPFVVSGFEGRHRRLSLCSLPAPKQTDGSLGSCLRRSARHLRGLAVCAPSNPDVLSFQAGLRCRRASEFLGRHEVLFSAFYCKHVDDHLSGYGQRRPILVLSWSLWLIDQSQFVAISRS